MRKLSACRDFGDSHEMASQAIPGRIDPNRSRFKGPTCQHLRLINRRQLSGAAPQKAGKMRTQPKFSDRHHVGDEDVAPSLTIAQCVPASNAVHQMQRDVQVRLIDDRSNKAVEAEDARRVNGGPSLHALVTVPAVIVGAACVMPLAVVGLGVARLARGRVQGLGGDTADTARAVWRATAIAIDVLTDSRSSRG